MTRTSVSPWAVRGLYLFAAVLVLSPLIDLLATVWPPRMGDLGWRFGFFGLAAGYLHTPLLGVVLAMAVAYWQGHATALRWLGILSAFAAVAFLPVLALWPLDVIQVRDLRAADAQRGVAIGGVIQALKYLGACLVLGCLALGCMRTASAFSRERRREPESPGVLKRD